MNRLSWVIALPEALLSKGSLDCYIYCLYKI